MRPDQHKKKKSAQYQKKHAGKGAKGGDSAHGTNKKPGKGSDSQSKTTESAVTTSDRIPLTQIQRQNKAHSLSADAPGNDESDKTFRRRHVASNWERYKSLSDEEEEAEKRGLRGADFQSLLSTASDAVAQFRFREEQSVEESAEGSTAGHADFLVLDFADLAASLQCVPLHKRLGIEENAFGGELIEQFCEEAKDHQLLYQPKVKDRPRGPCHSKHPNPEPSVKQTSDLEEFNTLRISNAETSETETNTLNTLDSTADASVQNVCGDMPELQVNASPSNSKETVPSEQSQEQTEVVAMATANDTHGDPCPGPHVTATSELEDWLDSVLDD